MHILYRANDSVESVNGKRAFGTKKEVLFFCYESLVENIRSCSKESIDLHIFYDSLSKESIVFFDSFEDVKKIYHHVIPGGNNKTFEACYKFSLDLDGPIFFLEDDYYLEQNCINTLLDFFYLAPTQLGLSHICINPMEDFNPLMDFPDIYNRAVLKMGDVFWLLTNHSTNTFIVDKHILIENKDCYLNWIKYYKIDARYNENNTRNLIYKNVPCFSPFPTLSEHMQGFETLSTCSKFIKMKNSPEKSLKDCLTEKISMNLHQQQIMNDEMLLDNGAKIWNDLILMRNSRKSEYIRLYKLLAKIIVIVSRVYKKILAIVSCLYKS